jgi:hypothetical protein
MLVLRTLRDIVCWIMCSDGWWYEVDNVNFDTIEEISYEGLEAWVIWDEDGNIYVHCDEGLHG